MNDFDRPLGCPASPLAPSPPPDESRIQLISVFKALSDETRLDVYRLIAAQPDPVCVCDIVAQFAVSQPTISHHLKVLREAGLISVSRRGNWAFYAPSPAGLEMLERMPVMLAPRSVSTLR